MCFSLFLVNYVLNNIRLQFPVSFKTSRCVLLNMVMSTVSALAVLMWELQDFHLYAMFVRLCPLLRL